MIKNTKYILNLVVIFIILLISTKNLCADGKLVNNENGSANTTVASDYKVKPAEIALPPTAKLGQFQRTIRPFLNWTLICDHDLLQKRKLCNISQKIITSDNQLVFSWTLATAENGDPLFIMRSPQNAVPPKFIELNLLDGSKPIHIAIKGCDTNVCVAYLTLDKKIRAKVNEKAMVEISFTLGSPAQTIKFQAPLEGLSDALSTL